MRAEVDVRPVRERRRARSRKTVLRAVHWHRVALWGFGALVALILLTGTVFAGSSSHIAAGSEVAGVKISGLTSEEATTRLEERSRQLASVPVVFTAGDERFALRPSDLDARVDWAAVTEQARTEGNWPMPFRGLKRVWIRLRGNDVQPSAEVYEPRLAHELDRMAATIDRPGRDAAIVLRGLEPSIVPDRDGRTLNRREAGDAIARALAGFERAPVELPVTVGPPSVTAEELEPTLDQVRTALSAPVRFGWKDAHWLVQPRELAELMQLPADGRVKLAVGGRVADRYFGVLSRAVNRKPRAASFAIAPDGEHVRVVPSAVGRAVDVPKSAKALLAGALATDRREGELVVSAVQPKLTTAGARRMKVTRVLASFTTAYSGSYDRIQNLRLAAKLIDGTRIAPGASFSFNEVVGPRTAKRGFRIAPTIVEGEYEDALGGGVSQVATTTFNAAWEAGLDITQRSAHSLYISRYPLGRDATVNYPDVDLKFKNDTKNWIVMRGQSGDTGITISLLGAPTNRRVVSEAGELRVTGPPEVESTPDPTLLEGEQVVEDLGEPSRSVTVVRIVYRGDEVLARETWTTSYKSEPKIVRVGTIPVPEEEPPPSPAPPPPGPPPPTETTPTTPPPPTGTTPTTTRPRRS